MSREIRILLLGDDQTGKSTLITQLIKECFVEKIQHVLPQVTVPAEWSRDNVTTRIVDSSPKPENAAVLENEIKRADVICIVYAVNNLDSISRISTFWLPFLRRLGRNVPVVLVGNKIDTRDNESNLDLVMPIMNEFKEIETCVGMGISC
jgi:mitochondrial Rho GTPase 1